MPEIDLVLPEPHPRQIDVLRSPARFKVLMCGRRFGKSLLAQWITNKGALRGNRIAYITPEFSLAKEFFKELLDLLPAAIIKSSNKSELTITFITGGYIRFFSGEAMRSMRGLKFHTVIIDEAAFITDLEEAWTKVIRPTLTDYKGNALFISTPRGRNYFHTLYLKGVSGHKGWASFHYTSYDNPHVAASEIDEAKENIPKAAFNQEYLAIAAANAGAVLDDDTIRENTIQELSTEPTVVYAIDVAKYTDFTSITGMDASGCMTYHDHFQKNNQLTKDRIRALPGDILKVMDSTHGSLGDGILEDLISEGVPNLIGFEFTAISKPQLITEMILDAEKGLVKFNEKTAVEMSIFEYKYSKTGYISYAAASGGHDDCVISLALANRYRKYAISPTSFADSVQTAA